LSRKGAEHTEEARRFEEVEPALNRLTEQVIGAAIEVHGHLGPGYLEAVYEEALSYELRSREIPFRRQHRFACTYKRHVVGQGQVDLLVADRLIVELKAVDKLGPIHRAQVISYLRALDRRLGLLINFNAPLLKQGLHRIILSA
jgi:GxxExxY protein